MILEIILKKTFKDKFGNDINNYKVFIQRNENIEGVWISETDFKKYSDLLRVVGFEKISDLLRLRENFDVAKKFSKKFKQELANKSAEIISLFEPFDHFYKIEHRQNERGSFNVLLPNISDEEYKEHLDLKALCENFSALIDDLPTETKTKKIIDISSDEELVVEQTEKKVDFQSNSIKSENSDQRSSTIINNLKYGVDNKITFIKNLLDYSFKKKIDVKTGQKLISLIGQEIEKSSISNKEILERLEIIENKIELPSEVSSIVKPELQGNATTDKNKIEFTKKDVEKRIIENKKKHSPQKVVNWLKLFTKDNCHIKFSTHLWDEDKYLKYEDFIQGLDSDIKDYKLTDLQHYSSNLYWGKVYPFLIQKELTKLEKDGNKVFGWGQYKIKIGWQYPDIIKQWSKENFDLKNNGIKPMSMELSNDLIPKVRIKGKTIKYFEDVVNVFKDEIEFRDNKLFIEVKLLIETELNNFNVDDTGLQSLKGRSFYTNTEYILTALRRIFKMIKSRAEKHDVIINSLIVKKDNLNYLSIEILHKDSFSLKELDHTKICLKEESGDLAILRTVLTSLCDFSIESKFRDSQNNIVSAKIDYLYEGVEANGWVPEVNALDSESRGFKFILQFPL
ncbi:hypothetical protein [Maribellus mangrovi]|uniref:hypothetical protein n=1 Tax=Maribellus mangrovi TaxID=3133146 RepID=UPI0030EF93A8